MRVSTRGRGWMGRLAAVAFALVVADGAQALPEVYSFLSGQIRVQASTGGQILGLSDLSALDGFEVVIDADLAGAGNGGLTSMLLTSTGGVDFALDPAFAEFDNMTLSDISLSGSGDINLLIAGPPDLYTFVVDPLTLAATLDAQDFENVVADISGMAINSITDGSGFLTLDTAASALVLQGVTIGSIALGGETLVLKADFVFIGEGVIPEPNGARLMGLGVLIVGLAGASRRVYAD